jgi:hypothetical protein
MGYAGICGAANVQQNSDPYFHGISLQVMRQYLRDVQQSQTCGTVVSIPNPSVPLVDTAVSPQCTIPIGNYFQLRAQLTSTSPGSFFQWDESTSVRQQYIATTVPRFRS